MQNLSNFFVKTGKLIHQNELPVNNQDSKIRRHNMLPQKKSQAPDPEQEIFSFALPQISWILYFLSAYALENQFLPHSSHEDSLQMKG